MSRGSLASLIDAEQKRKAPPEWDETRRFIALYGTAIGMLVLHTNRILHRDLKPENILLGRFDDLKIGDFGFARWMRSNIAETSCGSPHYAAPEVVRGVPYDGKAADIWSCGVILFALLAGRLPFQDPSIRALLAKVKAGQYLMPDFPPPIQSLISGMLTLDPKARIGITQIKEHEAFRIGLSSPQYCLSTPLPMPNLPDPVPLADVDEDVVALLTAIGYTAETLADDFAAEGNTMAKVFLQRLTVAQSLDKLPWSADLRPPGAVDLIMSPHVMPFASSSPDAFALRPMHGVETPFGESVAERPQWANFTPGQYKSDLMQPCVDIAMPLDALMAKMQILLTSLNFQWFHPDDRTLYGKGTDEGTYLCVKVEPSSEETFEMDLFFTQATQSIVHAVMDAVRVALTAE
jgi:BR serine/threonine kinase